MAIPSYVIYQLVSYIVFYFRYMKGHLSLEQLNGGITDINLILSKKYELFYRRGKKLSLKDEKLRSLYIEQGRDLKGKSNETQYRVSGTRQLAARQLTAVNWPPCKLTARQTRHCDN